MVVVSRSVVVGATVVVVAGAASSPPPPQPANEETSRRAARARASTRVTAQQRSEHDGGAGHRGGQRALAGATPANGYRRPVPDSRALRDLAVAVATEAGALLTERLGSARTSVQTKSTATDMVTEMDGASERLVVTRILAARPDDSIVGEEGADHRGTSDVRWVVDPLDGTTNYLYRLPGWNVSIGVEVDGVPVAGAVVVPGHGQVFAAARGHGATLDGRPIRVTDPAPLATSLVGTGFSYDPSVRARQAEALVPLLPRVRDIRRRGAAAADLCSVACGHLDAYYEAGLAPWDRCAGTVVAEEAGARVEVFDAGPLGDLTVAAHPGRWDEFVALLREVGAFDGT